MVTTTASATVTTLRASTRTTVLTLAAGALVASLANGVVVLAATAAGASTVFAPFNIPVFVVFTVAGLVAGFVGWRLVQRFAPNPRAALRVLVPVVLALSFIPDVAFMIADVMPGGSVTAFVGLMIMHLVVVAVGVPIYRRLAPTI